MASPLDFIEEKHEGPEPRVLTADVQAVLRAKVRPGEDEGSQSVQALADACRPPISTRTVYRILQGDKETIGLDLADRLLTAAGGHLRTCRLVMADGTVQPY